MLIGKPMGLLVENYSMSGAVINDFEVVYNHLSKKDSEIDTIFWKSHHGYLIKM